MKPGTPPPDSEHDWIRRVAASVGPLPPDVLLGIGDDAAVFAPGARPWIITTDTLTEGVDFRLAEAAPEAIGYKALAVNLSDIAAMAGIPRFALWSVVLPRGGPPGLADRLLQGLLEAAAPYQVALIGGDTNTWAAGDSAGLVLSITLLGQAGPAGIRRRDGARPGDELYLTGPVGGSLLGRHLHPTPRVALAQQLVTQYQVHALMDLSDGLGQDLDQVARASGVGFWVDATALPIHADAERRARQTGRTPLDHALADGEDFELIVAAAAGQNLPYPRIGQVTSRSAGCWLQLRDGSRVPWPTTGWQHEVGSIRDSEQKS
jgi:thiamine-monophosphate kinase